MKRRAARIDHQPCTLTLLGHVPSKKNLWRRRRNGGVGINARDKAAVEEIKALVTQARVQWGAQPAWANPNIDIAFFVRDRKGDRDNKLSCLLDVLQEARVIHNDNAKWNNGLLIVRPVVVAKEPKTLVTLSQNAVVCSVDEAIREALRSS